MGWRSGILAVAALLMTSGPAWADEAKERALAQEIMRLSGALEQSEAATRAMLPAMEADVRSRGLSQARAARYVTLFMDEFRAAMPMLLDMGAQSYVDAFSEAELTAIRDFYASPVGQALRTKGAALTEGMTRAGMAVGEQAGLRAAARLDEEIRRGDVPS